MAKDRGLYHTEDLLVYTPAYRNGSGVASCELKTMALAGQRFYAQDDQAAALDLVDL